MQSQLSPFYLLFSLYSKVLALCRQSHSQRILKMSGLNVLKLMRPVTMMRSLQVSPQLHSQLAAVRMMSSQKELQYIKVDTTGDTSTTSTNSITFITPIM